MDARVTAFLLETGGKVLSDVAHIAVVHHFHQIENPSKKYVEETPQAVSFTAISPEIASQKSQQDSSTFPRPTTEQTIHQLEKRLIRQIQQLEEDLIEGARIEGIPCDCILKHSSQMENTTAELQTMSNKPIYSQIRHWSENHMWGPDEVAKHPSEFFVAMVPEVRSMRKELSGSEPAKAAMEANSAECSDFSCKREIKNIESAKTELAHADTGVTSETKAVLGQIRDLALKVKTGEMKKEDAVARVKEMLKAPKEPMTCTLSGPSIPEENQNG